MKKLEKTVERIARKIKEELINTNYDKVTISDLKKVIYARINNNYNEVYETRLYKLHSVAYCRSLELIERYFE